MTDDMSQGTLANDKSRYLSLPNPGQLGLGSNRPESIRSGQLGLCNWIIEAVRVIFYNCVVIDRLASI